MATLDFNEPHVRSTTSLRAGIVWFFSGVSELMTIFAAAARVSAAVEARREPSAADLKILGIDSRLPL